MFIFGCFFLFRTQNYLESSICTAVGKGFYKLIFKMSYYQRETVLFWKGVLISAKKVFSLIYTH